MLVPIELSQTVPFKVARFFWICDVPARTTRGFHAHKTCQQYLICAAGSVQVELYDGRNDRSISLLAGQGLHIPPTIFATQRFDTSKTVLMVFCDKPYEIDDYLNDRAALSTYRQDRSGG